MVLTPVYKQANLNDKNYPGVKQQKLWICHNDDEAREKNGPGSAEHKEPEVDSKVVPLSIGAALELLLQLALQQLSVVEDSKHFYPTGHEEVHCLEQEQILTVLFFVRFHFVVHHIQGLINHSHNANYNLNGTQEYSKDQRAFMCYPKFEFHN